MVSYIVVHCLTLLYIVLHCCTLEHIVVHWSTLQHIVVHCSTLLYIVVHCSTLSYIVVHCSTLLYIVAHCCTLQHIVVHCRTLTHIPDFLSFASFAERLTLRDVGMKRVTSPIGFLICGLADIVAVSFFVSGGACTQQTHSTSDIQIQIIVGVSLFQCRRIHHKLSNLTKWQKV